MPVGFLSDSQAREYARFNGELTPDQLARYFHLEDADRAFVAAHRGDHNRLGVAVQLDRCTCLGFFSKIRARFRPPPCVSPLVSFRFQTTKN